MDFTSVGSPIVLLIFVPVFVISTFSDTSALTLSICIAFIVTIISVIVMIDAICFEPICTVVAH